MDDLTLSDYVNRSKDRILGSLVEWLTIPSISADPAHAGDVASSAEFCADLMRSAGVKNVETLSAGGVPAVYGDWLGAGSTAPTVLVYGHHDVQPVDPLDEWTSPPFVPVVVGDRLLARGASDDKGQVLMQIEAARGLLEALGHLPVNLKFLIEGEEEVGSPHLDELLEAEKERLAADVIVVSDSNMLSPEIPTTTISTRGLVAFDVAIRTAKSDLHSGIWGGTVPNAALVAARLAASLHDSDHRVTLPGFYKRVRELTRQEAQSLAGTPFDELEYCRQAGVKELEGEAGRTPYERTGTRPTAEVVGLHSGYAGPGMKTIVPATANLKVAVRLVPEQLADEVEASFRQWVAERAPKYADIDDHHGGRGSAPSDPRRPPFGPYPVRGDEQRLGQAALVYQERWEWARRRPRADPRGAGDIPRASGCPRTTTTLPTSASSSTSSGKASWPPGNSSSACGP